MIFNFIAYQKVFEFNKKILNKYLLDMRYK